jgi:hypothetical protein
MTIEFPALNDDLREILGKPNFWCGPIAHAARNDGAEIKPKAEDEQAFVLHLMLTYYFRDPITWRDAFGAELVRLSKLERLMR